MGLWILTAFKQQNYQDHDTHKWPVNSLPGKAVAIETAPLRRYEEVHQVDTGVIHNLVDGWNNLFEKYARQIGSFPQNRKEKTNVWNHHLVMHR